MRVVAIRRARLWTARVQTQEGYGVGRGRSFMEALRAALADAR